ncbi:hypothetical protein GDO78_003983 [Eleutherodactylus coqui]|uniref:Uncharacterized protein n=1 Tax=Eleutherodactylus coqui TaxID=57060 RepID=A0A8J6EVT3_ELECQ|nr:hypothetical protein GDO78_003983 [Eleutherodactylus coqui]
MEALPWRPCRYMRPSTASLELITHIHSACERSRLIHVFALYLRLNIHVPCPFCHMTSAFCSEIHATFFVLCAHNHSLALSLYNYYGGHVSIAPFL